jgi:RNA polymerase sigma-70 factor (ECF subfamily)
MTDAVPSPRPPSPVFATTRWTQVLLARGETEDAHKALGELCEIYWMPVFRFIRRERDEETARELAQEFFARLLEGSGIRGVDRACGQFRSFLLGAVKHFLSDLRRREGRLKHGGVVVVESLDAPEPLNAGGEASEWQIPDPSAVTPDAFFDRHWALTIMDRALGALERDFVDAGKSEQFQKLKPWLAGDAGERSQSEVAHELGMSEGALKVAVYRLRKKFRDAVREEIGHTLRDPALVDEELRHLVDALAHAQRSG